MKRWAVFWACLSVVPISFDAHPEPDRIAAQSTVLPRRIRRAIRPVGRPVAESIAPSAVPVDSTP